MKRIKIDDQELIAALRRMAPETGSLGCFTGDDECRAIKPPYRPGDILYVQETFRIDYLSNVLGTGRVHYKADDTYADFIFSPERYEMLRRAQRKPGWRPNKNMPREAARIFLRVTNVYPQRLKDVTETDARAEGFHSRAEFMSAILKMYPECMEDSWFWANEFERISREETQHVPVQKVCAAEL